MKKPEYKGTEEDCNEECSECKHSVCGLKVIGEHDAKWNLYLIQELAKAEARRVKDLDEISEWMVGNNFDSGEICIMEVDQKIDELKTKTQG